TRSRFPRRRSSDLVSGTAAYAIWWMGRTGHNKGAVATVVLALLPWFAAPAIKQVDWTELSEEPLTFATMQGNIPQQIKWDPDFLRDQIVAYLGMTEEHWQKDIILWPETAIPIPQDQAGQIIA